MALNFTPGDALADAFVSLEAFKAYCDARGHDYSAYDDPAIEAAIRRGTTAISVGFAWKGRPVHGRQQSLAWPRYDVQDPHGYPVDYTAIPREIVDATCEAAWYELTSGELLPAVVPGDRVLRRSAGGSSETYADPGVAVSAKPVLMLIDSLVAGLLAVGGMAGRVVRS